MAFSVTNIGLATNNGGATLAVTVGAGGVPSGALIFVVAMENSTTIGTCGDSASNSYSNILHGSPNNNTINGTAGTFYAANVTALVNGNTITYTKTGTAGAAISACYVTGTATLSPLDAAVSALATGNSNSFSVTSGTPSQSGELFIGAMGMNNTPVYVQASGWSTPPNNEVGSSFGQVAGGNKVNSGSAAVTYNPTSIGSFPWIAFIQAFAPPVSNAVFGGAGRLSAVATLGLQGAAFFRSIDSFITTPSIGGGGLATFGGTGSLSALSMLGLAASATFNDTSPSLSVPAAISGQIAAEFDGAGSLSASGIRAPPGGFIAFFNATGGLSVTTQQILGSFITFSGSGVLTPTLFVQRIASATFAGNGTMNLPRFSIIFLNGAGSLTVNATQVVHIATFNGAGSLSANAMRFLSAMGQFNGTGRMCVQATVRIGRRGPASNLCVTGSGATNNLVITGGTS
jgi:hypothetical protein